MLSKLMNIKKSLNLVIICGMLIFISDASAQTDYAPFPDEVKVISQIEKEKIQERTGDEKGRGLSTAFC